MSVDGVSGWVLASVNEWVSVGGCHWLRVIHCLLPKMEMTYSGFYSSNQVGVSGWVSLWVVSVGG